MENTAKKKIIIGIDLGTTNSAVAIYENDEAKIYTNSGGKRTTPSVVAFKKAKTDKKSGKVSPDEWIIGENAKRQAAMNHLNTLYGVKRLIGRRFDDPEVEKMASLASYKIVKGPTGDAWVEVDGKAMAPAEISAKVLRELKDSVLNQLGLKKEDEAGNVIVEAVITVPAYFNDSQRKATRDAGAIAGLDVKRIINEPTAAALAYGMDKKTGGKIAVFDLGGGTFDVSILSVDVADHGNTIEVLATNGDTFLGGENFDEKITEFFVETLNKEYGTDIDLSDKASKDKNAQVIQRLREEAERVKIELSFQDAATVSIPFLMQDSEGEMINFNMNLTRKDLEGMLKDLINMTLKPCQLALADAGKKVNGKDAGPLKASELDEIILVGGQTRMPLVIDTVKKFFGKDPKRDVNPDEIVAMGASVQGAVLTGKVDNVLLLDVIPLSIGIRTPGDVMSFIVPRNATIPAQFKETYFTAEDNQPNVMVKVYQGERAKASDNNFLGEVMLGARDSRHPDALPRGKAENVSIEIVLNIDADGVLNVTATQPATGKSQNITVKANGGLSSDQVARMLKEAEANAEKDKIFRLSQTAEPNADAELAEAAKDSEQDAEGNYIDKYFKVAPDELKKEFFEVVKELTEAKQKKDVLVMVDKTARLSDVRARIGDAFNQAAQPGNDSADAQEAAPEASAKDAPKGPTL